MFRSAWYWLCIRSRMPNRTWIWTVLEFSDWNTLKYENKNGGGGTISAKSLTKFLFFKIRNCLIFRFGSFPLNTFVVLTIHSSRNYRVFRIGAFRISIVKFVCIPFHVISFLDFIEMMYIVCTLYCTVYLAFRRYSLLFYDYIPIYFY